MGFKWGHRLSALMICLLPASGAAFTLLTTDPSQGGWGGSEFPVYYDPTNCPAGANLGQLVSDAVGLWNQAPLSRLRLSNGGLRSVTAAQLRAESQSGAGFHPVVACDPQFGITTGLDEDAVAAGTGYYLAGSTIVNAYILLNVQSGAVANINNFTLTTLRLILAHELGHVLGLGHTPEPDALMYFDVSGKSGLALHRDDADGIAYLYPLDEFSGGGLYGCGSVEGAPPMGGSGPGAAVLLLIPLLLAAGLRRFRFIGEGRWI